jgi:hypothetical protein
MLGGVLSFLCLIHCLVLPWMAALLPIALLTDESAHAWLFAALAPAALLAAFTGYRANADPKPAWGLVVGVTLVGAAAFAPWLESVETLLTVVGSLLLIGCHGHNLRLARIRHIAARGMA